jgi:peptidoglycan/xylan/chitin deacetylase (PgdA/CDA1 family)
VSENGDVNGFRFATSRIPYADRRGLDVFPDGARMALLVYVAPEEWRWGVNEHLDPPATWRHGEKYLSLSTRSAVEYGFNVGLRRIGDFAAEAGFKMAILPNATTFEHHRELIEHFVADGHPLVGHADSEGMPMVTRDRDGQRESIRLSVEAIASVTGAPPAGWIGPGAKADRNTIELLAEAGFTWHGDLQDDELPYFIHVGDRTLVEVPYRMIGNLNDLLLASLLGTQRPPSELVAYVTSAFEAYYAAAATHPLMMNYGMHPHISGRPDTFQALRALIECAKSHDDVWICTHDELAAWWQERFSSLVPEGGGDIDVRALARN